MTALAQDHSVLYESPDPDGVYCYSPGIAVLPSGRLLATIDLSGPALKDQPGRTTTRPIFNTEWQGKVYLSDDKGITWSHQTDFPLLHARPFVCGGSIYILGHMEDLGLLRSDDAGETWSQVSFLTKGDHWHQAPCNVHYANGSVYLVMERRMTRDVSGWAVGEMAPVLLRGRIDADLTRRENWTFASELSFRDVIPNVETEPEIDYNGVPFYASPYPGRADVGGGRRCDPMGWLETNVVQILDPDHYWFDPDGKTYHLWMRAHTGGTGYACIAKVVEKGLEPGTGEMDTLLETVPSGRRCLYVPCPGGQMKFHILYDEPTKLYWLLSTQATDSMRRADRLPADRYGLPNNERRRLQLHFSKNMVDWCFAGLVAAGTVEQASRHYASMAIDGNDLYVLSRSGDERAHDAHNGNLITFHRIEGFRDLVY